MKDLPVRLAVAAVGIPLLIFCVLKGGIYFFLIAVIISVFGQWELYQMLKSKAVQAQLIPGILLGLTLLMAVSFGLKTSIIVFALLLILYIFSSEMFRNHGSANLNIAGTLQGVIYPSLFLAVLLYLRDNIAGMLSPDQSNAGGIFIMTMFVSVWGCDTFAYFLGVRFGRHKLFERVSPKKSWEGGIAGLFGALLVFFLSKWIGFLDISYPLAIVSGLIVGVIGQLGDLVESWFKRDVQIKDSSKILPGHGGMLDRFDSLLFIAPAFLILYFCW